VLGWPRKNRACVYEEQKIYTSARLPHSIQISEPSTISILTTGNGPSATWWLELASSCQGARSLSPVALRHPTWSPLHIYVNLTSEQIRRSPGIDLHKPVSRQHEAEHHQYYGWPYYWNGAGVWGSWPSPKALADAPRTESKAETKDASADTHLRSIQEVTGYHIKAIDGEIGHLEDFLFDDETWEIRYAIVGTKNWWPGKKVLLRPQWIQRVSWADREIFVSMSRETVQQSPE
jgi:hypothetical protein